MSSKPSREGVANFRLELGRLSEAAGQVVRLSREIEERQKQLGEWQGRAKAAQDQLGVLMQKMDIHSSGNMGWSGRMQWFLVELYRQMSDKSLPSAADLDAVEEEERIAEATRSHG